MSRANPVLDQLLTTNTADDLSGVVSGFRDIAGLEHSIYHIVGTTGREFGAYTYDPNWVTHYIQNEYFRIDPVVLTSLRSFGAVDWRYLDWTSGAARNLIGEAVAEGVGKQGVSIPIRGSDGQFALFSVTSYDADDSWDKFLKDYGNDLLLMGHHLHAKAMDIVGMPGNERMGALSPRERDVLSLLAIGKSRADIGDRLKISEHTIRVYVDTARHKLGAANTTHAVATALHHGLILP